MIGDIRTKGQSIFVNTRTTTVIACPNFWRERQLVAEVMPPHSSRREFFSDICPNVYERYE